MCFAGWESRATAVWETLDEEEDQAEKAERRGPGSRPAPCNGRGRLRQTPTRDPRREGVRFTLRPVEPNPFPPRVTCRCLAKAAATVARRGSTPGASSLCFLGLVFFFIECFPRRGRPALRTRETHPCSRSATPNRR